MHDPDIVRNFFFVQIPVGRDAFPAAKPLNLYQGSEFHAYGRDFAGMTNICTIPT